MSTTIGLMTADELLKLPRGRFRYQPVKAELITMSPAGSEHGAMVVNVTVLLAQYVKAHNLGIVLGADEELDGQDVAPGFRCRVSEIFAGV